MNTILKCELGCKLSVSNYVLVRKRTDFTETYADNFISMKIGICSKSFWNLEGSDRKNKIIDSYYFVQFMKAESIKLWVKGKRKGFLIYLENRTDSIKKA